MTQRQLTLRSRFAWIGLLVTLAAASAWAGPAVFAESPMVKVRPTLAAHPDLGFTATAARNEFVSFQVVVHGQDTGATAVSAQVSALSGPGTISGTDVTIYREGLLTTVTPSTPDAPTGAWPDPLIPDVDEIAQEKRNAFPFDVPAGEARALWIDIHVPAAAAPGMYTGNVAVSGAAGLTASVPLTLTVLAVTLPSTPTLTTAFGIFAPNVCTAHTGSSSCVSPAQQVALMGRYAQMALEHRFTLTNVPQGDPNADWSAFDAAYAPLLNGTTPARLPGAKMTTVEYFGALDPTSYGKFATHFKASGWYDRAFDYTADEPPSTPWATLASRAQTAHQGAPDLRTLATTDLARAQANGVLEDLDILTPNITDMDPYGGSDQAASYAGFMGGPMSKLWLYQSCNSHGCAAGTVPGNTATAGWPDYMVDCSAARNRAMEWVSFREGGSGELYYETAMSLPTAWSSVFAFNGNGDGTLFYPGTPAVIGGTTDVPVASIRMKLLRLGVQDYEWLELVSAAGDPAFAQKVAASVFPNTWSVSDDGSVLENAHASLVARVAQLTHVTGAQGSPGQPGNVFGMPLGGTGTASNVSSGTPPTSSAATGAGGLVRGRASGCSTTGGGSSSALIALGIVLLSLVRSPRAARWLGPTGEAASASCAPAGCRAGPASSCRDRPRRRARRV